MRIVEVFVWIRIPLRVLYEAVAALKMRSSGQHTAARLEKDKDKAIQLRHDADESDADAESIRDAVHGAKHEEDKQQ